MNLYPDPLSSLIVSRETGQEQTPFAQTYLDLLEQNLSSGQSSGDKDWFQVTVLLDLPNNLPPGTAYILVYNNQDPIAYATLEVVEGTGTPNALGPTDTMISALGRVSHYTVYIQSDPTPHAVELLLTHDADSTIGGTGKAYVVNPVGYQKSLSWSDNGTDMKVIITPTHDGSISDAIDFKFYVAGGITNLAVQSVQGYDINGNSITGVSASINND